MPKNKKKHSAVDTAPTNGHSTGMQAEEDDVGSVLSSLDGSSYSDFGDQNGHGAQDDTSSDDQETIRLEDMLIENLDLLYEKSSKTRLSALAYLDKTLCQKVVIEVLSKRVFSLMEVLNKGIKRASGSERCSTARTAMLMSVQLGTQFDLPAVKPVLTTAMSDHAVSAQERSMCATALGLCVFISSEDSLEVIKLMETFELMFVDKRLGPVVLQSMVNSWSLLLTVAPARFTHQLMERQLPVLQSLLQSDSTAVKIAAGQAISLLFEVARDQDMDVDDKCAGVFDILQDMAADSDRYKGRKDRTQQRSCFRDFVQTVEDGSIPEKQVKVGSETLRLDSWARLVQYGAIRDLLGNGLHAHLQSNEVIRDVFDMGPVPIVSMVKADRQLEKMEKKYYNAMFSKMRTQSRGKQRDKRSDFA